MKDFIGGMLASLVLGTMLLVGAMYQLSIEEANACTPNNECEIVI